MFVLTIMLVLKAISFFKIKMIIKKIQSEKNSMGHYIAWIFYII
jgi:hypothetical protein